MAKSLALKPSAPVQKARLQAIRFRNRAHAPYSKYRVGAGVVTKSGKIFGGCNVENVSYGGTICAERVAILKAVSEGHKNFSDIVVVTSGPKPAPPCAFCLQVMAEFCKPDCRIWIGTPSKITAMHRFGDLLTFPFTPDFL